MKSTVKDNGVMFMFQMCVFLHLYLDHHFKSENASEGIVKIFEHLQKKDSISAKTEKCLSLYVITV